MSNDNDLIISTNADNVVIENKEGSLFKISNTSTNLGSGAYSSGLNAISIGCSIGSNDETTETETSITGKLSISSIREENQNNVPSHVLLYNRNSNPKELTYSSIIPNIIESIDASLNFHNTTLNTLNGGYSHLETASNKLDLSFNLQNSIVDASFNQQDVSFNILDSSFNVLDSSFNILDTSFNLQKSIVDASLNIHDVSLNILDNSLNILDNKQNIFDTSYNNQISQQPTYGNTFSIGSNSYATGTNSFAIGSNASTGSYNNSAAIGSGTISTSDNKIFLGNTTQQVVADHGCVDDLSFGYIYGTTHPGIIHKDLVGTADAYAWLQSNSSNAVLINAPLGQSVGARVNNIDVIKLESDEITFYKQIKSPNQPMWSIYSATGGDQSYGANGRIGAGSFGNPYLGGQSLNKYFDTINKWNTTHNSWNSTNGAFFAKEGGGIYIVDMYIFGRNSHTFSGRIKFKTNAPYSQDNQYNMDIHSWKNDTGALLTYTWYAADINDYFYYNVDSGTLNVYHASDCTHLRVTKIA
tara:strand:- start:8490 stop:10073 length:1584 start_codon:yes stop_codon:yes gene_type:complete